MQNTSCSKTELRKGLDIVFKNAVQAARFNDNTGNPQEVDDALAYLRNLKCEVYERLDIKRIRRKGA